MGSGEGHHREEEKAPDSNSGHVEGQDIALLG